VACVSSDSEFGSEVADAWADVLARVTFTFVGIGRGQGDLLEENVIYILRQLFRRGYHEGRRYCRGRTIAL